MEEYSVSSVSLFELKYEIIIQTFNIKDKVLSPLAFLDHAIEKLRNEVHREKNLLDAVNDDWFYGKIKIVLELTIRRTTLY